MFSQPMYPAENLGYWKARADKAEDRADDLTAEIERLREVARCLLTTIEDAVSVGEMDGFDFRLDPWASLRASAEKYAEELYAESPT